VAANPILKTVLDPRRNGPCRWMAVGTARVEDFWWSHTHLEHGVGLGSGRPTLSLGRHYRVIRAGGEVGGDKGRLDGRRPDPVRDTCAADGRWPPHQFTASRSLGNVIRKRCRSPRRRGL
jgi:hypothetical protein